MLEPMQHLHAELPRYLAEKGDSLSPADLQRFRKQEQIIGPGRMRTVTSWWCHSSLPRPPGTQRFGPGSLYALWRSAPAAQIPLAAQRQHASKPLILRRPTLRPDPRRV